MVVEVWVQLPPGLMAVMGQQFWQPLLLDVDSRSQGQSAPKTGDSAIPTAKHIDTLRFILLFLSCTLMVLGLRSS